MTGILLLFTENPTAGERDSEKFVNPDIKSVHINIDGVPNMLYSKGMLPTDQWGSIKQRFPRSLKSEVTETEFTQKTSLLCGSISGVTQIMKFTDRDSL